MAVGLITDAKQAESYLADGRCDLVALAPRDDVESELAGARRQGAGGRDPLDLLPKTYAWWLRRRDEVRRLYPTGKEQV